MCICILYIIYSPARLARKYEACRTMAKEVDLCSRHFLNSRFLSRGDLSLDSVGKPTLLASGGSETALEQIFARLVTSWR